MDLKQRNGAASENKVWYLKCNQLFANASAEIVEGAERIFTMKLHPPKSLLFDQGDTDRIIFLIKTGKVRLTRLTEDGKEVTVAILGPGDMLGEDSLFDKGAKRTTNAIVLEEALVCSSKAEDLFALVSGNADLAINVAQVLNQKLIHASAAMEDLAYAKLSERLMHLFSRLATDYGLATARGTKLDIRLTHSDIASLVGSTRESVSAEMSLLAQSGRILVDDRAITLPTNV